MRFLYLSFVLCFVVYGLTAVFSCGYYNPDEHYQVIEFAELKSGPKQSADPAWEYDVKIRSALQPGIACLVFASLRGLGLDDPYMLAMALRFSSMGLALFAILAFVRSSLPLVAPGYKHAYVLLSCFLWFLPFLNVRFSSENWSGLCFLLALAFLQPTGRLTPTRSLLAGAFLGLSFLFRFQGAILTVGLLSWLLVIARPGRKHILLLLIGGALVLLAGIGIDTWFYGQPVYTPWNYFRVNLLEGAASSFGTSPLYFFVVTILESPFYPFGILLTISLLVMAIRSPKHYLVWTILPFLVLQSAIPHKEIRFLFPVINLVPLLVILACQEWALHPARSWLKNVIFWPLAALNVLFLVAMTFRPAGNTSKSITQYIRGHYPECSLNLIVTDISNPYMPYLGLNESFYGRDNTRITHLDWWYRKDMEGLLRKGDVNLLVLRRMEVQEPRFQELIQSLHFRELKQSVPGWIQWLNKFYEPNDNENVYILYTTDDPAGCLSFVPERGPDCPF